MIFAGTAYRASMLVSYWCHHCSWLARLSRRAVNRAPDTGALVGKIISLSDSSMKLSEKSRAGITRSLQN